MISDIILHNYLTYPKMQLQDIFKLIFQSSFGCGHLIKDKNKAYSDLLNEWDSIEPSKSVLYEDIGNGYCRLNLSYAKYLKISPEMISKIMFVSSQTFENSHEDFYNNIKALKTMCLYGKLPFSIKQIDDFMKELEQNNFHCFSHTKVYKENYSPSYRVILKKYADYITLFSDVYNIEMINKKVTIGIDGNCASGKTTLGNMLKTLFDCNLFHADDYFLPPKKRTLERLNEPGGNFDYERFNKEIINGIKTNKQFYFTPFSCSDMRLKESVLVKPKTMNVVEGSYCMHPYLDDIYDIKVFLTIDYELQKARILQRNGKEKLKDFIQKWIPMENKYFDTFKIKQKCDYVF